MAINPNVYKRRIKTILDAEDIEGVRETIVGAPYFNKIETARSGTLYITTKDTVIDDSKPIGNIATTGFTEFEHTLRINLVLVVSNADGVRAEIEADDTVARITDVFESNARLREGTNAGIAQYSFIENVFSQEFASNKTARVMSLKIAVDDKI